MRPSLRLFLLPALLLPAALWAKGEFPGIQVVPWNGHRAASSLTFDGSDPTQLDVAVPELARRRLTATFFLTANHTTRKDEWRGVLSTGNELGNHTLDDFWAGNSIPPNADSEVVGARNVLQKEFGTTLYTFAYPSLPVTPGLKELVAKTHLLARGGEGKTPFLTSASEPDWMEIPSRETEPKIPVQTYKKWVEEAFRKGGWLVWRIQGLEGAPPDRQPITRETFNQILDALQAKDIWVGTFLEVGAYFRAQKIFEKASISDPDKEGWKKWAWEVPAHFPRNVVLKIRANGNEKLADGLAGLQVRQGRTLLSAEKDGIYSVNFDAEELEVRPAGADAK